MLRFSFTLLQKLLEKFPAILLQIAFVLGSFDSSILAQEFKKYNAFSPYSSEPSLTFQSVPPFDEEELKSYSAIPEPQTDPMPTFREDPYRNFDVMGQPNVSVRQYNEKNFSGFYSLSSIDQKPFNPFESSPYAPFSPFNGFDK